MNKFLHLHIAGPSRCWPKSFFVFLSIAAFLIVGCQINVGQKTVSTAGVFKSADRGENWSAQNLFLHSGGTGTIAGISVLDLAFDPQDNRAIYMTSEGGGLFYTYDAGKSWRRADSLGVATIQSVAIDPSNKCIVYATYGNTLRKSIDCTRTWREIYIDTRSDKNLTALAIDHYNSLIIYAGNNAGDVLKSIDGGSTWQVVQRLKSQIEKILIDPNDSRIIYFATRKNGLYKSVDAGLEVFDINDGLKPYSGSSEYKDLVFDSSLQDSLLLVAKYGLLKSDDGGETWQSIQLITPVASTDIYAVAINPENNKEIYYTTASTFYKSVDGGQNWITRRLPSNTPGAALLIDPENTSIIYLGMKAPAQK